MQYRSAAMHQSGGVPRICGRLDWTARGPAGPEGRGGDLTRAAGDRLPGHGEMARSHLEGQPLARRGERDLPATLLVEEAPGALGERLHHVIAVVLIVVEHRQVLHPGADGHRGRLEDRGEA